MGTKQKQGKRARRGDEKKPDEKTPAAELETAPLELVAERLDQELAAATYFDPGSILDPVTGATLPLHQWPEHARRALASYEEEALFESVETGEIGARGAPVKSRVQVGVLRKIKWLDKTTAQRLAYQRLGALVEKHEHRVGAPVTDDITDEEWEAIALLHHKIRPGGGNG